MTRRRLGWFLLIVGTVGALATAALLVTGSQWLRTLPGALDEALTLTADTLTQIQSDLDTADDALLQIDQGLAGLTRASTEGATALTDAGPLLEDTRRLITGDVPDALQAVEDAMPALIDVAAGVDTTMRILSGLGIADYQQQVPLDQAIADVADSLEGLPEELRAEDDTLRRLEMTLEDLTAKVGDTATSIVTIRRSLQQARPAIGAHRETIGSAVRLVSEMQTTMHRRTVTVGIFAAIAGTSLLLLELAAAYAGLALIRGQFE